MSIAFSPDGIGLRSKQWKNEERGEENIMHNCLKPNAGEISNIGPVSSFLSPLMTTMSMGWRGLK